MGDIITLLGPPDFINIELFPNFRGDNKKTKENNKKLREEWIYFSITSDDPIVIPIGIATTN